MNFTILHVFESASGQRSGTVLLTITGGSGVTRLLKFDDIINCNEWKCNGRKFWILKIELA